MEENKKDLLTHMDLEADNQVRQQLGESARWGKFIAIVMFIAAGLIALVGIVGGQALSNTFTRLSPRFYIFEDIKGPLFIFIFLFVAAVIAGIYYFLYHFSIKIKTALIAEDKQEFNKGLKSLKIFFIITTVLAMLSLASNIYQLFI